MSERVLSRRQLLAGAGAVAAGAALGPLLRVPLPAAGPQTRRASRCRCGACRC